MTNFRVGKDVRGVRLRKSRSKASVEGAGECVCPNCGFVKTNPRDTPCERLSCPQCGTRFTEKH